LSHQASFRFYTELNDFLPKEQRDLEIEIIFEGTPSVKHMVESQGIPHPEIRYIFVERKPVDFTYLVQNGDRIKAYPASIAFPGVPLLNPNPAGELRFILDNHLGKLAAYLRMVGFDALYRNDFQDEELARLCESEERILLTRDQHLLMRSAITYGYWVRAMLPRHQLVEVLGRYQLADQVKPLMRCLRCNGKLQPVPKEDILNRLEPLTKLYYNDFHICPDCERIYWRGSHYEHMQTFIRQVAQSRVL